jgi:hypothetical protein
VTEPIWRMSPQEEAQQHGANADAMQSYVERRRRSAGRGETSEPSAGEEDFAASDAIEDDPLRHPLVADLLERSTRLMKLADDEHDQDSRRWSRLS